MSSATAASTAAWPPERGAASPHAAFDAPLSKPHDLMPPTCAACTKAITERFILRVQPNLEFHAECLKCVECHRALDENQTVFLRGRQAYCRDDYLRLYGRKCRFCRRPFYSADLVMRARDHLYHSTCFMCQVCTRPLVPGTQFVATDGGELFCPNDCFRAACSAKKCVEPMADDNSVVVTSGMPFDSMSSNSSASSMNGSSTGKPTNSSARKSRKDKPAQRVRTVLSEAQLKILKQMYSENQRPDTITKEKLVEQTGLSQRVIRVWFQNKRCKDKKRLNAVREQQQHLEKEQALHGVRVSGIGPIMAASPTTMLDGAFMQPAEIQQFPQSAQLWAAAANTSASASAPDASYHATQLMDGFPDPNEMCVDYTMDANAFASMDGYSPAAAGAFLPNSSLSSSPTCSD